MSEKPGSEVVSWIEALLSWFSRHGRRFPWRETRDWYRVLVAEFMLIRTRSEVVEKVYREFLERFPTPEHLCRADIRDVETFFKRLGLVQRSYRLHSTVCHILQKYGGAMPCSFDELSKLPGIVRYVAHVLLTRVCEEAVPFVDTNVLRVLRRFLGDENLDTESAERWLLSTVPKHVLEQVNIALLDLAALVCKPRRALCTLCPLANWCRTSASRST